MDEIGLEWFSRMGSVLIRFVNDHLSEHDFRSSDMIKVGISIGFGQNISPATASVEDGVKIQCQKAIRALHGGVDEAARTPENLPILTFLMLVGSAVESIRDGDHEGGMRMLFLSGLIWGEIESKSLWKLDTYRGTKVAGGAKNSASKINERHNALRAARFARMSELVRVIGVEKAARQCEAEGMGGWQGIKKQWDRHKNRDT